MLVLPCFSQSFFFFFILSCKKRGGRALQFQNPLLHLLYFEVTISSSVTAAFSYFEQVLSQTHLVLPVCANRSLRCMFAGAAV